MRIKKIMKYYENDIKEITLPDVEDFTAWGIPLRDAVWTKTGGKEFGMMCCVSYYDDKYNVVTEKMSFTNTIVPVFVLKNIIPAPVGHHVFVGNIPCVVISENRAMSCCPSRTKRKINTLHDFDWSNGFKFENTELYQYLNTDYWTLEVAREDLVDKDFVSDEEPEEEIDEENKKAMAFADALYEEERLFFDTENYRVTGIYYTDRGDGTGYFVEENFSYLVILNALSCETEDEFMTYIYDHRELDRCFDSGTECFMWFYYDWVDRTDYVEFSKENLIDGVMSSYYGDNVLRNIKEWAEKAKGYDASEVFTKRGIY